MNACLIFKACNTLCENWLLIASKESAWFWTCECSVRSKLLQSEEREKKRGKLTFSLHGRLFFFSVKCLQNSQEDTQIPIFLANFLNDLVCEDHLNVEASTVLPLTTSSWLGPWPCFVSFVMTLWCCRCRYVEQLWWPALTLSPRCVLGTTNLVELIT